MEFMFWGCFSYDKKGPCHIWKKETAQEKQEAQDYLDQVNAEREPVARAEWERKTAERRSKMKRKEKEPQWRWNKANGKLI